MSPTTDRLYCFGGWDENVEYSLADSYMNISTGEWSTFPWILTARAFFGGAVVGEKIYFCGGLTGETLLNTMEVFDCREDSVKQLKHLPGPRSECAAAALNGFIYVSGGEDESYQILSSVLRYCIAADEWQPVKPMNRPRRSHQLVTMNGRLYAVGGYDENSLEEYDPDSDQWRMLPNAENQHYWFGAAELDGKLYVCSDLGFEVYSPDSNTWRTLTPLNEDLGRKLVSVNGKIWSVGGGESNGTKAMFEFEPSTEQWIALPNMNIARRDHSSFVVHF